MMLIVALGNPGKKYAQTRHNAGWRIADALADELGLRFKLDKKNNAEIAAGEKIILAKPQTFMNNSGDAVKKLNSEWRMKNSDILIVRDEIDLSFGKIRLSNGGSAGHRGDESVTSAIGAGFSKLRIGIENRKRARVPDTEIYVLQPFTAEEDQILKNTIIPSAVLEIKKLLKI